MRGRIYIYLVSSVAGDNVFFVCFSAGHVHLTDFNIATILEDGKLATSMSGTKPYMGSCFYSIKSLILSA